MSDKGTLAAVQKEIMDAINGTVGIVDGIVVIQSMSLDDLMNKDSGGRNSAIGIMYMGTDNATPYAIGSRRLRATTKWRIAVAHKNLRGSQFARDDVYAILEGIRDRLHYLHSASSPKAAYMFQSEAAPDTQPEGKVTAYSDFSLDLILGQ